MGKPRRMTTADVAAGVVLALAKQSLTVSGVAAEVFDNSGKSTVARKYVRALHEVGMVRVVFWRKGWPYYRLNATPFEAEDAPTPADARIQP